MRRADCQHLSIDGDARPATHAPKAHTPTARTYERALLQMLTARPLPSPATSLSLAHGSEETSEELTGIAMIMLKSIHTKNSLWHLNLFPQHSAHAYLGLS